MVQPSPSIDGGNADKEQGSFQRAFLETDMRVRRAGEKTGVAGGRAVLGDQLIDLGLAGYFGFMPWRWTAFGDAFIDSGPPSEFVSLAVTHGRNGNKF